MSNFGYNVLGFGANASTSTGPSDDEFNRVSFKSSFEGANNGVNNVFDDGSASNHTITAAGNVTQGSFGPFARPDGEWGISYNDGYMRFPDSADWTLGDTFTLEAFIFPTKLLGYNNIMSQGNWYFTVLANGALQVYGMGGDGDSTSGVVALNTWSHVAFSVSSGTGTFYVNGVARGTTSSNDIGDGSGEFYCGKQGTSNWPFYGVQSNYRVVKGTAVYTSNFTVPTSKLTAITNTKLLTGQSNRFVDNSASGHVAEVGGTIPAVTAFGPFLTSAVYSAGTNGASAYFDGNGDYLSIANSSDFNLAANDFCFEFWFWCDSLAQYDTIFSLYNTWAIEQVSSGGGIKIAMWISSGSSGSWNLLSAGIMSNLLKVNEWNHLVIARTGNTLKSYHNGAIVYNSSFSGTIGSSSNVLYSGTFDTSAYWWDGYISDVKLSNGSTGGINVSGNTITVPTAPLAVTDSNTKLLLNMADGQAIDSAAQTNLTLFGNAKISTGQAKFGDTSLLLDGTGDFLHLHNRRDLSGPFCIEAFARADDTGTAFLWCLGQYRLELGISEAKLRIYRVGTATAYTDFFTGGEFTVNNWHHVALVRDTSNVIKCYLNGTASGTTVTDATAFVATDNILIIGGEADGTPSGGSINHGWDGYVDDFRISDFARYTSNFTAPSEPFADKGQ